MPANFIYKSLYALTSLTLVHAQELLRSEG